MQNTNTTPAAYIVWDHSSRNHEVMALRGTLAECEAFLADQVGDPALELHENFIKDSWDNEVSGVHYDTYSDDVTVSYQIAKTK